MVKIRSGFVVLIAAAIGVAILIACYAVQTKPAAAAAAKGETVTVRDSGALMAALKKADAGDVILLAPGAYATIGIQGLKLDGSGVTVASADRANPVVVAGIEIANASGLTFRDLEVTLNARTETVFNIVDSRNIRLERLHLHGPPQSGKPGLMFRNSANVGVYDSKFHDVGTAVRNIDSTEVVMSGNDFREIYGDGIQSTGSSNVTITRNHFTNFHTSPGDHPDAIQFFTLNQKAPVHDIVITENVVIRGAGDITQGIFLGNEISMPYVNVKIAGNKIIGAMFNGIAIGNGQNVVVSDNLVQAYRDQDSWIRLEGLTNSTVENNQSTALLTEKGNVGLTERSNKKLRSAKVGDISALTAPPTDK